MEIPRAISAVARLGRWCALGAMLHGFGAILTSCQGGVAARPDLQRIELETAPQRPASSDDAVSDDHSSTHAADPEVAVESDRAIEPGAPADGVPSECRLEDAQPSLEALSRAVLEAIRQRDAETLDRLRVNRHEYLNLIFPEFDAAKRADHLKPEFHWFLINSESQAGIRDVLGELGGREFELIDIERTRGINEYPSFRLHRKVRLRLQESESGNIGVLRIFDSVAELDGGFKILSYPS